MLGGWLVVVNWQAGPDQDPPVGGRASLWSPNYPSNMAAKQATSSAPRHCCQIRKVLHAGLYFIRQSSELSKTSQTQKDRGIFWLLYTHCKKPHFLLVPVGQFVGISCRQGG